MPRIKTFHIFWRLESGWYQTLLVKDNLIRNYIIYYSVRPLIWQYQNAGALIHGPLKLQHQRSMTYQTDCSSSLSLFVFLGSTRLRCSL
jgi:hypothetical protein